MVTITKEPKPRLEPIILSPEHQIEVQKIMTNPYRSSTRSTKMRRISCLVCRSIPDYMVIYDYDGASKVERYCTSCLEKSKMELNTI